MNGRVLLIDGDSWLAPPIAACFGRVSRPFDVVSAKLYPDVLFSRFCHTVHYAPAGSVTAAKVCELAAKARADVIMACTDPGIRFLSEHRKELESGAVVAATAHISQLDTVIDKCRFAEFLEAAGLPHPHSIVLRAGQVSAGEVPEFPVLVKPAIGYGGIGIRRIENAAAFQQQIAVPEFARRDWVVQSFIPGRDLDVSVLCRDGSVLADTIQTALGPGAPSFGAPSAVRFVHEEEALSIARELVAALKWTGVAHIDMRRGLDGHIYIIELNGRYWGSLYGSCQAGINFPELACLDALGESFPYPAYQDRQFWMLSAAMQAGWRAVNWRDTELLRHLADPGPLFVKNLRRGWKQLRAPLVRSRRSLRLHRIEQPVTLQ